MCIFNPNKAWLKILHQKYRHKQKRMGKMFYSEPEPDFYNFAIDSLSILGPTFSDSKSEFDDSESDFNSVFINLDICIFLVLCLHSSK